MTDTYSIRGYKRYLSHLRTYRRFYILAAAIIINIFLAFSSYPLEHMKRFSYLSFTMYGVFLILSLPLRLVPGLFFFGGALTYLLWWINETKSDLTQLPLTYLDFKITLANPEGVINALKAPEWAVYLVAVLVAAALLIALWAAARIVLKTVKPGSRGFAVNVLLFLLLLVSAGVFIKQYDKLVKNYILKSGMAWESIKFAGLSRTLGIWGFLTYSYYLEQTEMGEYYKSDTGTPPGKQELIEAAKKYIDIEGKKGSMEPNIIVVQAESTFNPEEAFTLSKPIHNKLFERNKYTRAVGPMIVNAVGGGSWITEFEFITGLDSRMFGYSGYYTHSSLSPYIDESFATYLKKHGYVTEAYYAVEGEFYNAANAYRNYGFDKFVAGIGQNGWHSTDEQVINSVIGLSEKHDAPFFKFIITTQNHSPHTCRNYSSREQLATTFKGMDDFNDANCILNEFIRNMESTEQAFLSLIDYLEEQEKQTGRPFVLLIYGDHQPHTFSTKSLALGDMSLAEYRKYRKDPNERVTFFHIVSSIPGVLNCCTGPPPHITMMPTLLSAYVASGYDDLYLGVNLYSYSQCGSDFMNNKLSSGAFAEKATQAAQPDMCPVYENLLTAYRSSGIFSYLR